MPTSFGETFHSSSSLSGNLLLQGTIERIHVGNEYGDIPRGIYLVRGENVALCGEIVSAYLSLSQQCSLRIGIQRMQHSGPSLMDQQIMELVMVHCIVPDL